jgi:hypothetical protein
MVLGCREFEIFSSWVHSPCFYASIREWFLLFNSRPYRHYTAVIMLPYQAHISPDTTYTETDSSSVGQGVHGEEFYVCLPKYVCLFLNKQINKQYITRLETKLSGSDRPNVWFGWTVRPNFYCAVWPKWQNFFCRTQNFVLHSRPIAAFHNFVSISKNVVFYTFLVVRIY